MPALTNVIPFPNRWRFPVGSCVVLCRWCAGQKAAENAGVGRTEAEAQAAVEAHIRRVHLRQQHQDEYPKDAA